MEMIYLTVTLALAAVIGLLSVGIMKRNDGMRERDKRIAELEAGIAQAKRAWAELKQAMVKDDPLVAIALEYVKAFDAQAQSGEWKFHQAYAAMLKDKRIVNRGYEKWKIGVAIHDALRELKTHATVAAD